MASWLPHEDAKAKELWLEGRSASMIGREVGRTRNAVIGRIHRLGLSRNGGALTIPRPTNRPITIPEPKLKPTGHIKPCVYDDDPEPHKPGIDLLHRQNDQCPFPIGDEIGADIRFCGAPKDITVPYCKYHYPIAYQSADSPSYSKSYKPKVRPRDDTRKQIWSALNGAGKEGVSVRDLMNLTGRTKKTVRATVSWLRKHENRTISISDGIYVLEAA